jgi:LPS-assembly lipoprotein
MSVMRTLAAIALVATLSGCGFQLRGSGSQFAGIEGERIFVSDSQAATVAAQVRSQLGLAGAALATGVGDADYRLLIARERLDRQVLSVSPQTGKVEEYQLLLRVSLSITAASGQILVDQQQITLSRDFTYDEDAALGKFSEEQLLREEMTREAADQILRRLGAQISKKSG